MDSETAWDRTVFLGVTDSFRGREYLVRRNEGGDTSVFAVIRRKPVNPRGFYQQEEVYRTIKPGSANYRAAVTKAEA